MNDLERWQKNNEDYLAAALKWLRLRLLQQIDSLAPAVSSPVPEKDSQEHRGFFPFSQHKSTAVPLLPEKFNGEEFNKEALARAAEAMAIAEAVDPRPPLLQLCPRLGMSQFEQQVLLLCAAMELDPGIANLCAQAQGNPNRPYPTFALALSLFDDPAWDSLSPERPLRYWRHLEINQPGAQPLTTSPLRADERIVNYIKGLNYLDDRLTSLVAPMDLAEGEIELPPSQQEAVETTTQYLNQAFRQKRPSIIQLLGPNSSSKQLVAQQAAKNLGLFLYRLPAELIPPQAAELETFVRLWQRESLLLPIALYLDAHEAQGTASAEGQVPPLYRFLSHSNTPLILSSRDVRPNLDRPTVLVDIDKPTTDEQRDLWEAALGDLAGDSPAQLASQFNLNPISIQQIAQTVLAEPTNQDHTLSARLWSACLASSRPQLDVLAQRLDAKATWDDIVLPEEEESLLHQVADQVRQRHKVYQDWGFENRMNRGLGISALFAGESGTGKTMAAEVIANELRLNLYRIDLSAVVSKYIGETEKNLRRLFDAAEDGGAILFFDEADALFGKRSEVKDSHDRYANIEINYLLQRMEAFRGLAILATNMRSSLDQAFVRRLRFIVTFQFPSPDDRQKMWQHVFPTQTLTQNLNLARLARLNLTGGSIHNVALNAAFLAAQKGTSVTMPLVLQAARTEFRKLDRPINEVDFRWQEPAGATV
jgi:ATPase family associated with various cellular activities (AAA)